MTVKEWLSNVKYDEHGQHLWSRTEKGNQIIAELRGWGVISKRFMDMENAEDFQNEVGKFIANAINEKVKRETRGVSIITEQDAIAFHKWMLQNDTQEKAEAFAGYSDADMFNEFKNKQHENAKRTKVHK